MTMAFLLIPNLGVCILVGLAVGLEVVLNDTVLVGD